MAAMRWSSDFIVGEYRDIQANIIALNCVGDHLLLPGRRHLAIKNINEPIDEIQVFQRISKYDIENASWNPHIYNKDLFALCSGTSLEILSLNEKNGLHTYGVLKSHTRTVTDVDWHPIDPNILISSSVDTFTHIWDIRVPQKPVTSFSSFAGASHAKWNKLSRHLLATTHAGDVKIWDERKNFSPVQYITAHLTSIHSINWSPAKENHIATGSQDGNIKIFDITEPQKTYKLINPESPVWKIGYAPFGNGSSILGVMVPEVKKTENSLLLWHLSKTDVPLHTFVGHTEIVLDFEWRVYKQDVPEYQLITWDKNQTLRIWEIDKHLVRLCAREIIDVESSAIPAPSTKVVPITAPVSVSGENRDMLEYYGTTSNMAARNVKKVIPSITINANNSNVVGVNNAKGSSSNTMSANNVTTSSICDSHHTIHSIDVTPKNLHQEFALNYHIRNAHFDKMDAVRRLCNVTVKCNGYVVVLLINFPPSYPRGKLPIFRFIQGTTVNAAVKNKLLKVLKDTAEQKVKNNEVCLESCIMQLVYTMEQTLPNDPEKMSAFSDPQSDPFGDNREPLMLAPRTCGAKFCHIGSLVCFMKPKPMIIENSIAGLEGLTPEQSNLLSTLYLHSSNEAILSPRARYINKQGLLKRIRISTRIHRRLVVVYDLSSIFLVNRKLAEKYTFTGSDIPAICRRNATVAASIGRKDLHHIWNLVALLATASSSSATNCIDWDHHPFARDAVESIVRYYAVASDIQTAAMLCCLFSYRRANSEFNIKNKTKIINDLRYGKAWRKWWTKPGLSPYHTVHPIETLAEPSWNFPVSKQHRSNSWSECLDDLRLSAVEHGEIIDTCETSSSNNKMLGDDEFYETVKILYADILDRWGFLESRTLVMKCINSTPAIHRGVEFVTECSQCKNSVTGTICPHCRIPSLVCVICRLSVKGSANFCLSCGHGGHTIHMKQWFRKEQICPSGCKCRCLIQTAALFKE